MRQISQTKLVAKDVKYEPSKPCELCGQPTLWAAVRCQSCLEAIYVAEELAYTRDWLRAHPGMLIELGHDDHRRVHLVFLRANVTDTGWCGARVSQMRPRRTKVPVGAPEKWWDLLIKNPAYAQTKPPGLCDPCWKTYKGMAL